jgi:hypothetical protein
MLDLTAQRRSTNTRLLLPTFPTLLPRQSFKVAALGRLKPRAVARQLLAHQPLTQQPLR